MLFFRPSITDYREGRGQWIAVPRGSVAQYSQHISRHCTTLTPSHTHPSHRRLSEVTVSSLPVTYMYM